MSKTNPFAQAEAGVDEATDAIKQGAHAAIDKAQNGIDELSRAAPAALSRAAAQMEDLTRRTMDRARQAGDQVREKAYRASDVTVGYIKDEPLKAMLIAAAVGAVAAGVFAWLARPSDSRR
jgi:ElaB/YqjD/DUF883 family membrane-anchored ribosome-binding protein